MAASLDATVVGKIADMSRPCIWTFDPATCHNLWDFLAGEAYDDRPARLLARDIAARAGPARVQPAGPSRFRVLAGRGSLSESSRRLAGLRPWKRPHPTGSDRGRRGRRAAVPTASTSRCGAGGALAGLVALEPADQSAPCPFHAAPPPASARLLPLFAKDAR